MRTALYAYLRTHTHTHVCRTRYTRALYRVIRGRSTLVLGELEEKRKIYGNRHARVNVCDKGQPVPLQRVKPWIAAPAFLVYRFLQPPFHPQSFRSCVQPVLWIHTCTHCVCVCVCIVVIYFYILLRTSPPLYFFEFDPFQFSFSSLIPSFLFSYFSR